MCPRSERLEKAFQAMLPAGVAIAAVVGDDPPAPLLDEEEAALGAVAGRRRTEFTMGRSCARRALEKHGRGPVPILGGAHREPIWPEGFVGSITHCHGHAAAAVSRRENFAALGIDAEEHDALPDGVGPMIATRQERAWLRSVAASPVHWDRVLFSAKESLFKAWFPLERTWLGFEDAVLDVAADGTFRARLRAEPADAGGGSLDRFEGRHRIVGDLVLTAAWLSPDQV